jgi:hypothetical protein
MCTKICRRLFITSIKNHSKSTCNLRVMALQIWGPLTSAFIVIQNTLANLAVPAFLVALTTYSVYILSLVIYRLKFSPLAKFPGPRLAATTSWVRFYHDYFQNGSFIFEIERMHQKYGMYLFCVPPISRSSR